MAFSKTLAEMEQNVPDSDARKKLNALFDEDSFNELDKFLSADGAVGIIIIGMIILNNTFFIPASSIHIMLHFLLIKMIHRNWCIIKCRYHICLDICNLRRSLFHAANHIFQMTAV